MKHMPPYLRTELISIREPTPIEAMAGAVEVIFTRRDSLERTFTIYAAGASGNKWSQWGAPVGVLKDNEADVRRWFEARKLSRAQKKAPAIGADGYEFTSEEQKEAFYEFQSYVAKGFYSRWKRDTESQFGAVGAARLSRLIREVYVTKANKDFPQLGGLSLGGDGSTIEAGDPSSLTENVTGFKRLMVGNHGVYIEFKPPGGFPIGRFVKKRLQYNEYRVLDAKLYQQFARVNYADYRPGSWYVSLYEKELFTGGILKHEAPVRDPAKLEDDAGPLARVTGQLSPINHIL